VFVATRLDPEAAVGQMDARFDGAHHGEKAGRLPNLGGSLPNEVFAQVLGLPTVWIPHSYAACSQHAPNEHLLASVAREGLRIMTAFTGTWANDGCSAPRFPLCAIALTIAPARGRVMPSADRHRR